MYRRELGGWVLHQTITPPLPPPPNQSFPPLGYYVALEGHRLAVGGIRDSVNNGSGTVWVFEFDGSSWVITARLDHAFHDPSMYFGFGLELVGDELYVGVLGEGRPILGASAHERTGRIDRYELRPTGWALAESLAPESLQLVPRRCAERFATNGDVLATICTNWASGPPTDRTYVRIFERNAVGWAEVALMPVVDYPGANLEGFGMSIDVFGDWIAVGCPLYRWDPFSPPGVPGQVYLYRRTAPGVWSLHQRIQASNAWFGFVAGLEFTDEFGVSLDFARDGRLLVGARNGKNSNGVRMRGQAYLFEFDGTNWVETARFGSVIGNNNQGVFLELGTGVAIDGDYWVAGDPIAPVSLAQPWDFHGAVYFFESRDPLGQTVCVGQPNSTGTIATLAAYGSRHAHIGVVDFVSEWLPPFAPALLIAGDQPGFTTNPGGSAGHLCLGNVVRLTTGNGPAQFLGYWSGSVELPDPGQPGGFAVTSGSTWRFQLWYRQPGSPPSSNFSSAVEVQFE
jgi:hypothetical protein